FGVAALLIGGLPSARWRGGLTLVASVLALYWLQPSTPIRHLDFWLPSASLALVLLTWVITRAPATGEVRPTLTTAATLGLLVVAIGLTRYFDPLCCLTPSRPPDLSQVAFALGAVALVAVAPARLKPNHPWWLIAGLAFILGLFVMLKTDALAGAASAGLRSLTGQPADLASALDIRWLGFSYIAFRLLHVLRDGLARKLPALSLQEFVIYALFFPALTAGPIDRVERFIQDLRRPYAFSAPNAVEGGARLALGLVKKFVISDSLAIFALSATSAAQTTSPVWMWVLVYAYAWRLYLDFAGYTDIAIGLGRWMGVRLPENFDRPYFKPNLTTFWNSWHITLTQWFRAYVFNPLTRALRSRPLPPAAIILAGQILVMVLIGLWHAVTWNFVVWGLWHAAGLFVHNRWAGFARPRLAWLDRSPGLKRAGNLLGIGLTFHYVALGWVWFALPNLSLSRRVLQTLVGL
ncbi:MAG: MBOAT family O-acyltransferase, partial [Anaerolineales bacterium]